MYARIHIDMKNIAFQQENSKTVIASILRHLADRVEPGDTYRRLLDPNGSHCGTYEIVTPKPKVKR